MKYIRGWLMLFVVFVGCLVACSEHAGDPADTDSNGETDSDADTDTDSDADSDGDTDGDTDSDGDADSDSDTDGDSDADLDTDTSVGADTDTGDEVVDLTRGYHVATDGDDAGTGTLDDPFATIQRGVDALSQTGDRLVVHEGTYNIDGRINVSGLNGSEASPIEIRGYGRVVVHDNRTELADWAGLIDVRNSSWIVINGFTLEQPRFFGIFFQDCSHVVAKNNSTSGSNASGIAAWTSFDVTIENNDIASACNSGQMVVSKWETDMGCQECISIDGVNGFAIRNNTVHDAQQSGNANWGGGEGIDVKNGSSNGVVEANEVFNIVQLGIYVDAWENDISNVEIFRNHVHHNANGIVITSEQTGDVDDVRIHDNIIHDIGFVGISISHYDEKANVISDVQAYNNTVAHVGYPENKPYFLPADQLDDIWGDGIVVGKPDVVAPVIRDNIVRDIGGGVPILLADGLTGYTLEGNLTADPLFVDYPGRNFALSAGSPAINAAVGTRDAADIDFAGRPRIAGGGLDAGALEAQP